MGSTSCTACSTMGGFLLINTCCRVENVKSCLRKCWIQQLDPSEKVVSCELLTEFSAPARCDSSPHSPQQGHQQYLKILEANPAFTPLGTSSKQVISSSTTPGHSMRMKRCMPLPFSLSKTFTWRYLRLRHFTLEPGIAWIARCSFS